MRLRWTDTPCHGKRARLVHDSKRDDEQQHDPALTKDDASDLGPRVAGFSGAAHAVVIDDDGDIWVYERKRKPTRDKTHQEQLRELNAKLRKIWERES